jgi:hypothetical protein
MIRAAFPLDRRRNARMSPATATSAASPTARSDQSCVLSCASVPATETVRGSLRGRSGDSCSCPKGDPGFAASRRAALADSTSLCSPRSAAGPAPAWTTVFCGDLIDGAVGSTAARCTWDALTTLAATGASVIAGASAECPVATGAGRAADAVVAAGVSSVIGGAVSACADSAAAGEATSATGADPAAAVATRGGSKLKGST